jgi:adenine-specific DNA-methyltransferase
MELYKRNKFCSALDAFGGTSCFSYKLKDEGKQVCFNDILKFNSVVGLAIIENSSIKVTREEAVSCYCLREEVRYSHFIEKTFRDIYYTDEENRWLDIVIQNIHLLKDGYKKAILFSALGQACLIKRPFNLFHRANLYLRFKDVNRTFSNKTCWDSAFQDYFERFINEYNSAIFQTVKEILFLIWMLLICLKILILFILIHPICLGKTT